MEKSTRFIITSPLDDLVGLEMLDIHDFHNLQKSLRTCQCPQQTQNDEEIEVSRYPHADR